MQSKRTVYLGCILALVFNLFYLNVYTSDCLAAAKEPHTDNRRVHKKLQEMPFYVFNNSIWPPVKNFAPSGYMGDISDIKITGLYTEVFRQKYPSLKVTYPAQGGAGWCGVLWQNPPNNWGELDGGYNLSKASKLTFWAKGEKGGEIVEFKIGGILSIYPDSANISSGDIELTDKWAQYTIDLKDVDLHYISAGFGFVLERYKNEEGCIFYLDDIKYEE